MKQKLFAGLSLLGLALTFAPAAHAQTYGAAYVTSITYQNLSSSAANITFTFYSETSGTSAYSTNINLPAYAAGSLNVGSTTISAGFKGSTVMASDQPVAATLVQLPPSGISSKTRPLSDGFSSGSSTVLIGTALRNYFSTSSIMSIQNTDSVNNNFVVSFYAVGSTTPALVVNTNDVPPGSAKYYDLGSNDLSGLGAAFNGSAVVVATKSSGGSPGSAVATVLELSTNTGGTNASAFEGASTGATTVYMPSAMCHYSSADYNSNFALQNTSNSTTATVTTTFSGSGVVTTTQIGPYGKASVNACTAGNVTGYLGAATITSNQPIIAIGKISGGGLSTAFLGATEAGGASKTALPYVRWASQANYDNSTKQRTFITVQNVGSSTIATGTVTVKYYDVNGNLVSTHTSTAQMLPGGKITSNPNWQDPTNATYEFGYSPTTGGSAIVEGPSGSKLAVVVRASTKLTATNTPGEDYNGIPVP